MPRIEKTINKYNIMETNKTLAEALSEQKTTNFWIGLVLAFATLYLAFEWTDREVKVVEPVEPLPVLVLEDEMIPITQQPEQQPAAPVMVTPEIPEILNIVDDKTELPDKEVTVADESTPIVAVHGDGVPTSAPQAVAVPGPVEVVAPPPPPAVVEVAPPPPPPPAPVIKEVVQEDETIYDAPQVMASFPGGEEALYKWLNKNLKYPPRAQDQGVQGRVMVKFIVNKDGSIQNVTVLRSPDKDLETEAVRVVKAMPHWIPAKQGNKEVRSYFSLPVLFKIQ